MLEFIPVMEVWFTIEKQPIKFTILTEQKGKKIIIKVDAERPFDKILHSFIIRNTIIKNKNFNLIKGN